MSSVSPASILFDQNGVALAVSLTSPIPANTSGLISLADGYVTTAAPAYSSGSFSSLSLDTLGNLRTFASQGSSPWVVSGTVTVSGPTSVSQSGTWVVNSDGYATTAAPAYTNSTFNPLSLDLLGNLRVLASQSGAPWSTSIAQGGNTAVVKNTAPVAGDQALVVAISPNSALNITTDGYVTTAAPVYVNNTSGLLSLTTAGSLRVQGVAESATGAAVPTNADYVGSLVVSTPPTLTAGNLTGLNSTTAGRLIVDGSQVTQPVSQVGTWTVSLSGTGNTVDGYVTTAAPSYSANSSQALSLDTSGNLRTLIAGTGAAGSPSSTQVVTVQGVSGGTPLSVTADKSSTSNITSVNVATSNTLLLAANANRVGATFYVNTNSPTKVYLALGATATTSLFTTLLLPGDYWELPDSVVWTGAVSMIGSVAQGAVIVTELTP